MSDDAFDAAVGSGKRLVHEVHVDLLWWLTVHALQHHGNGTSDEWRPGGVHLVEQVDETLLSHFRQRVRDTLVDNRATANEMLIRLVGEFEPMLRTSQYGEKRRGLGEHLMDAVLGPYRRFASALQLALGHDLARCLRRGIQECDDVSRLITDGTDGVGEPCLVKRPVRTIHLESRVFGVRRLRGCT